MRKIGNILVFLLVAVTAFLAGREVLGGITSLGISDFYVYYYIPKAVLTLPRPEHPYTNFIPIPPYFFPPASLVLFRPLIALPFHTAKVIWTVLNVTLLYLSAGYLLKTFKIRSLSALAMLTIMSLLLIPVRFTLEDGQFNVILLFILSYALYALTSDDNKKLGGSLLGLGVITKISPLLLVLYAGYKRKFTMVISAFLTVLILSILAEMMVKPGINYYYIRRVVSQVSTQSSGLSWTDQSLLGLLKNYKFKTLELEITGRQVSVSPANQRSFLSYLIVALILGAFLVLDIRAERGKKKGPLDLQINFFFLTTLGVVGTGLTWFHQYTILMLPLWGMMIISALYLKKPYSYVFLAVCMLIFSSWGIRDLLDDEGPLLQKHMLMGAGVLLSSLMFLKLNPSVFNGGLREVREDLPKKYARVMAVLVAVSFLFGLQVTKLDSRVKEARDSARVKTIKYMTQALQKTKPTYQIGSSTSTERSEKLDEGYVLFSKGQDSKVRGRLSILLLDPLNRGDYKYYFESPDGKTFTLKGKLESRAYMDMYGEFYTF